MNRSYRSLRLSCGRAVRAVIVLGTVVIAVAPVHGCGEAAEDIAAGGGPSHLKQLGLANEGGSADESATKTDKGGETAQPSADESNAARRKIIYDARIDLVVESLTATEQAIVKLIRSNNGFVAESDRTSLTSTQRRVTWRVRVPVDQFDAFVGSVSRLGEVKQQHIGSQDVTAEFVDIEARIRNKHQEEKRLLKHLSDSTGKLEDILAVERELARVRGEIESVQGRLKFLSDRTALSTVTIEATEWKDFRPEVAASFPTQLGRTFRSSVDNLMAFGRGLLLLAVALVPWVPLILIGLGILIWAIRALGRSSRKNLIRVEVPARAPG